MGKFCNMNFEELVRATDERVNDFHFLKNEGLLCTNDDFVPAVHYPPITKYPPIEYDKMFKNYTLPKDKVMEVYIHIPFCAKRCIYCHYPSLYKAPEESKDKYIDAMEKEFDIYKKTLGLERPKIRVVLIGGGTPTDLNPKQLERLLKTFNEKFDLSETKQFNVDVSPSTLVGDIGREKLRIMREYGVDRLTIGVQSLNETILRQMNRDNHKPIILEAIKNTLEAGFQLDIEFIFGYPNQTLKSWYEDLQEMVKLDAHEIQFYRLKIQAYGDQQGTINKVSKDKYPSIDDTMRMKEMAILFMEENGYHENLRRVFTKEKKYISLYAYDQCCNLYDQMSFGLTAFSSLRDRFVLNTQNFDEYYAAIDNGKLPYNRGFVRSQDEQERWSIILPLKNYNIRKNLFKERTGVEIQNTKFYPTIQLLKEYGLVEENDRIIQLTRKGSFFADEVSELFYSPNFIPFDKTLYNAGRLNPYMVSHNV